MVLSAVSACGAPANERPASPGSGAGGGAGTSGAGGRGGFGGATPIGSESQALTARVETPEGLEVELVTVACAGECAEVIAVARGGRPPYAFAWSDGVESGARSVCPDARTTYGVQVSDTPLVDSEFPYAGQTTSAMVTAEVLQCPDGGVADAAAVDASVEPQDAGDDDSCIAGEPIDPSCVALVARTDCFGFITYDLPEPIEVGERICVRVDAQPSADLITTLSAGAACDLWEISSSSPASYTTDWSWSACLPAGIRVERFGLAGFTDPSTIRSVRYCPRCDQ